MAERVVPRDPNAERVVLGAMLSYPEARAAASMTLLAEDFYVTKHADVFRAVLALIAEGKPAHELTALATRLTETGSAVTRDELVELAANSTMFWHPSLETVADRAARRRMIAAADAQIGQAFDLTVDFAETFDGWGKAVEQIRAPDVEPETATEIVDLRAGEESAWAIPGVLRRRERVIVTGGEGAGKSHLGRWVAMSIAAGRAPFADDVTPIDAEPTLIIDLENEAGDIGDAARRLAKPLAYAGGCHARSRPQGLDLTQARDVRWLTSIVAGERPALLVVGPLYKMYRGAEGRSKASEEAAEIVAEVLDELRVAYDCALWIEAHAPHGEGGNRDGGRPRGSSLWLGWPNFGRFLERQNTDPKVVRLKPWRGDRHRRRSWPWGLREGGESKPWVPLWDRPGLAEELDERDQYAREAAML